MKIITSGSKYIDIDAYASCIAYRELFKLKGIEAISVSTSKLNESITEQILECKQSLDSYQESEEQEFITDLYFLKKHGNNAVHSSSVKKDGIEALECLKRAFEIAISYCVYYKGKCTDILKLQYDTELMLTGQKNKSLAERYTEAKEKSLTRKTPKKSKTATKSSKKSKKQSTVMICRTSKKKFSLYWIFVGLTGLISLGIILTFIVMLHI